MNGTTRQRLTRNLPPGYFADAQDHVLTPAGSEVAQQEAQPLAEAGGVQFEAVGTASSGGSQATQYAPADTLTTASSLPAQDDAGVSDSFGVKGAGGGERSLSAGLPAESPTLDYLRRVMEYGDAHAQQLHAARVISGRAQG